MRQLKYPRQDDLTIRRAVGWGDENLLKPFLNLKDLRKALLIYRRHHIAALVKGSRLLPGVDRILVYLLTVVMYWLLYLIFLICLAMLF